MCPIGPTDPIAVVTHGQAKSTEESSCDYPSEDYVLEGVIYANGSKVGRYRPAGPIAFNSGYTDPINNLLATVKAALNSANRMGELKDGNIPVRNIWDTLDWANENRAHLPLIQFGIDDTSNTFYAGDALQRIPFSLRLICWVAKNQDRRDAEIRSRELLNKAETSLYIRKPFSAAGAARQALGIRREREPYIQQNFAIGAGAIYTGDILDLAGV